MQKIKKERMTKVLGYLVILFYVLYLVVLFAERTVAVVMGFTADEPFCLRGDIAQWYAHIATVFALVSSLVTAIALNGYVFRYLFTRSEADKARIDHGNMAITAGLLLIGGMAHTEFTLLGVQFVSYGFLLLSMLMRTIEAGMLCRPGISRMRLAVSYLYIVCFSMAIPVVYSADLGDAETAFVVIEIVTALLLVAAFAYMLSLFYRSGGLLNFGLPLIVYTTAADIAIFLLRLPVAANVFVMVFLALTVVLWLIGRIVYGNAVLPYFCGRYKKRGYFEGWYIKLVSKEGKAMAFILSYHADEQGKRYAMLQFAGEGGFGIRYDVSEFSAREDTFSVRLGGMEADISGLRADVSHDGHTVLGEVRFGEFVPPTRDIMGPFASFPFMECKHGVLSLKHALSGHIVVDGREYSLDGGTGYIEKDLGRSFPSEYFWTQGTDGGSSVMAAVAEIPYLGLKFSGVICSVHTGGREYRLATYNFARADVTEDKIKIARGRYALEITSAEDGGASVLAAPSDGGMSRTVSEVASGKARYVFTDGGKVLLDMTCEGASHEIVTRKNDIT